MSFNENRRIDLGHQYENLKPRRRRKIVCKYCRFYKFADLSNETMCKECFSELQEVKYILFHENEGLSPGEGMSLNEIERYKKYWVSPDSSNLKDAKLVKFL